MVHLCSGAQLASTPRSCRPSEQMGCLAVSALTWMAQHLFRPIVAIVLNLMATDEVAWWSSLPRLVGAGRTKPVS